MGDMPGLSFSKREWEVVDLLLQAKSNKQIALILHLSESTVEYHLQHIYEKIGVESRSEAIVKLGKTPIPSPEERLGISIVANHAAAGDDGGNPAQVARMNQNRPSYRISLPILISICAVLVAVIALAISALSGTHVLPMEVTRVMFAEVTRPVEVTRQVEVTRPVEVTRIVEVIREVTRLVPAPVVYPGPVMAFARDYPSTALLADGRVLVAGGSQAEGQFLSQTEIFDPSTNSFTPAADLHTARHETTATALPDGRVLVIGGYIAYNNWLTDAELYDPTNDTWTVVPPLTSHGVMHTATLLPGGRVLVIGGATGSGQCTERVEFFEPATLAWSETTPMLEPRASHSATLLADGRVLVAGGDTCQGDVAQDALLFDPQNETWSPAANMVEPVHVNQAVLLPDGRVLVAGGLLSHANPNTLSTNTTQIYDPVTNSWQAAMPAAQQRYNSVLVALSDGRVVMAGGSRDYDNAWTDASFVREVELFDPTNASWQTIGLLPEPRAELAALLLPGDRVFLVGGRTQSTYWNTTWIIDPKNFQAP
jgi:DNA-binding CsgD family transcriptional regulator/N-acetylneuraminic acid mutarotase